MQQDVGFDPLVMHGPARPAPNKQHPDIDDTDGIQLLADDMGALPDDATADDIERCAAALHLDK